jgi:nucleotide-binding universal stress UspA family protein
MFQKILVPVAGTETDTDTIKLACRFAKREKARILVVHVIPIERALPLTAELTSEVRRAESVLEQAERAALQEGCDVETDLLQARSVGPSIVDEAVERKTDLIIMGITYKRRFGLYSLGDVTPYVLKNAPCPVMLFQQSPSEQ